MAGQELGAPSEETLLTGHGEERNRNRPRFWGGDKSTQAQHTWEIQLGCRGDASFAWQGDR